MILDRTVFASDLTGGSNDNTWEGLAEAAAFDRRALARLCSVSTRTLNRFFRRSKHQTACDWMNELRLSLAWQRLETAGSVKEVAIDLGYKEASNFTRSFKNRFGVLPSLRLGDIQKERF
jgi:AraC-like DNA-binding protein